MKRQSLENIFFWLQTCGLFEKDLLPLIEGTLTEPWEICRDLPSLIERAKRCLYQLRQLYPTFKISQPGPYGLIIYPAHISIPKTKRMASQGNRQRVAANIIEEDDVDLRAIFQDQELKNGNR